MELELEDDQRDLVLESLQLNHARYSKLRDDQMAAGLGSIGPADAVGHLEELIALVEEG